MKHGADYAYRMGCRCDLCREWKTRVNRKAQRARNLRRQGDDLLTVPADRLRDLLLDWIERDGRHTISFRPNQEEHSGIPILSELSGIATSTLYQLRDGMRERVSFTLADKLLMAMGREHLWHLPQEDGGFADIYEIAA